MLSTNLLTYLVTYAVYSMQQHQYLDGAVVGIAKDMCFMTFYWTPFLLAAYNLASVWFIYTKLSSL